MARFTYGIVPPSSLREAFRPIENAESERFTQFFDELLFAGGFHVDNDERCERIGKLLDVSGADVAVLLGICQAAYDQFRAFEAKGGTFADVFHSFVVDGLEISPSDDGSFGENEQFVRRMEKLLSADERIDEESKIGRLENGFTDRGMTFSSLVDLRPNFSPDRQEILGFVPTILLQITTDSEDPRMQRIALSLNVSSLQKLKATVEDIELKLRTVANQDELRNKLYRQAKEF